MIGIGILKDAEADLWPVGRLHRGEDDVHQSGGHEAISHHILILPDGKLHSLEVIYHYAERAGAEGDRKAGRRKVGFYVHLGIYIVINAALWALWFLTTPGVFPTAFITIFWGIGVVSHAIGTYFSHHYTETLPRKSING